MDSGVTIELSNTVLEYLHKVCEYQRAHQSGTAVDEDEECEAEEGYA